MNTTAGYSTFLFSEAPGAESKDSSVVLLVALACFGIYMVVGFKWFFFWAFSFAGEHALVVWWPFYKYAVAAILFFAIPHGVWRYKMGGTARELGFKAGNLKWGLVLTAIGVAMLLPIAFNALVDPAIQATYPLERAFVDPAIGPFNLPGLIAGQAFYVLAYYIPYEYFFRGFVQVPLVKKGKVRVTWVVLLQTALTTVLHWDTPASELVAALAVGIVYGLAAIKLDSLVYVLVNHVLVGLVTNVVCVLVLQGII